MADESWWADKVHESLSQGDIIAELPFLLPTSPVKYLRHETLSKGRSGWSESTDPVKLKDGRVQIIGLGRLQPAIVLSHDCELDKKRETPRVILAAVSPISSVAAAAQAVILQQGHRAYMPLPDIPGMGTCMVNFRAVVALDRALVEKSARIASMTEETKKRLQAQLVEFFLRLRPELD